MVKMNVEENECSIKIQQHFKQFNPHRPLKLQHLQVRSFAFAFAFTKFSNKPFQNFPVFNRQLTSCHRRFLPIRQFCFVLGAGAGSERNPLSLRVQES